MNMRLIYLVQPTIRLSKIICPDPVSRVVLSFPTEAMTEEMVAIGEIYYLTGFENCFFTYKYRLPVYNNQDGTGRKSNMILSNG